MADQRNDRLRRQREEDPERFQNYNRTRYQRHREAMKAASRRQRRENPEAVTAREKAYKAKNPEVLAASRNNRRARACGAVGKLTKAVVVAVRRDWDGRCAYCRCEISTPHLDHKTPLSRGGTNLASNLHITCKVCNSRKHTKTHEEFMHVLAQAAE